MGSHLTRKKIIVGPNYRRSNDYARRNNFRINDFAILHSQCQLRGIGGKNIEFVLLNGWYLNEAWENEQPIIKMLLNEGATQTYVNF